MEVYEIIIIIAILTTGLAAGVFFTFTTLIIPGLMDMSNRDSLKGFQAIDRRLQPNSPSTDWQPVFGVAVFGAAVSLVAAVIFGFSHFSDDAKIVMIATAAIYNLGFWLPTLTTILPFNNRIRDYNLDDMSDKELKKARADFELNWQRWNLVRTLSSFAAFVLLIVFFFNIESFTL